MAMRWLKFLGIVIVLSIISMIVAVYVFNHHSSLDRELVRVTPVHKVVTLTPFEGIKVEKVEKKFEELRCDSSCGKNSHGPNYTSPKVLVIGASTFIGSSIALHLHEKKVDVIPVETEELHLLNSLQFKNWERLALHLEPLIVESNDIISALDELKHVDQVIYVPRNVFDCVLDTNIFKEEGTKSLEFLVNLLEAIKNDHSNIRVTLITRPKHRLTCMQAAWLKTHENSMQAFSNLYGLKIGFIRIDGVINEMQEMNYGDDLLNEIHCVVMNTVSSCLDLNVAIIDANKQPPVSAAERNIRQKNVVMSTYFTTIQNPQYAITIAKNTFKFMQDWLISANRLGIQAIIFHDSLSDGFIERIKENFDNVVFNKVVGFKGRTPNDYRFYLQYNYLQHHPEISNVIISDIRDITFFNDPFEVMHVLGSKNMYVGMDVSYYTDSWSHAYPRGLINACYRSDANTITVTSHPFYNAGVIGSTRQLMLNYLKYVTESLNHTPRGRNCNMATITIVTHKFFRDKAFSGYPFQSAFKMDIPGPQGLAVKHKIEHKNL